MNTPMGQQKATITLATDGDALTGTMEGQQGTLELKDGAVDGDTVSWKADITNPMPITLEFSATVDGDSLSGDVKLGSFGNASFTGTRIG
jgi:hypothetical protein